MALRRREFLVPAGAARTRGWPHAYWETRDLVLPSELMASAVCPICQKPSPAAPENASFPFCSGRCKLIDLGNWLDGNYRVPGPQADPLDEQGNREPNEMLS
jgi:uncharacterized protein